MTTILYILAWAFFLYCVAGAVMALWSMFRKGDPVTYRVEESAWFMLCPVWMADDRTGNLTPIPRTPFLDPWFELNLWLAQAWNCFLCAAQLGECGAGFVFHHVSEVEAFDITI
jgi:hypothetical protein